MTLGVADARFLLPGTVRRAAVDARLPVWRETLAAAGVTVDDLRQPDLAVAPAAMASSAVRTGAPMILLDGFHPSASAALRRAGYEPQRYRAFPSPDRASLLLPLGHRSLARHAMRLRPAGAPRWKRAARELYAVLLGAQTVPPSRSLITVGVRRRGPPLLMAAAQRHGVDVSGQWYLALGSDNDLQRSVFVVFPPGSTVPRWVVKFGRVPQAAYRFERDETGLDVARQMGADATGHAPRLLGRFDVDGLPASVETAAVGDPLHLYLAGPAPRAQKLATVESIAAWIITRTARARGEPPPRELLAYLGSLAATRLGTAAAADLVERVAAVPAVAVHGDLCPANLLVRPGAFTAVDWEQAQPDGLPLCDLLDFGLHALPLLEERRSTDRVEAQARLLRMESPLSPVLVRWIAHLARALDLSRDAVAAIMAFRFLTNAVESRSYDKGDDERLADLWFDHSGPGPSWRTPASG